MLDTHSPPVNSGTRTLFYAGRFCSVNLRIFCDGIPEICSVAVQMRFILQKDASLRTHGSYQCNLLMTRCCPDVSPDYILQSSPKYQYVNNSLGGVGGANLETLPPEIGDSCHAPLCHPLSS